jgi:tRNA(fMet)-specific endonuclease VapC
MLDTDISSYITKRSDEAVVRRVQTETVSALCISVITKAELLFGVEISPRRQENQRTLDAYLRMIEVCDLPDDAAIHYAQIRAHLLRTGTTIGPNDLFIAAHDRSLCLTVVTNNTREFNRVPGLKLENWTDPAI